MSYKVYQTLEFKELFLKLQKTEQERVLSMMKSLVDNPFQGKPLGVEFFREKKISGKRVYYMIYDNLICVLMLSISDKKTQQRTIDKLRINRDELLEYVKKLNND